MGLGLYIRTQHKTNRVRQMDRKEWAWHLRNRQRLLQQLARPALRHIVAKNIRRSRKHHRQSDAAVVQHLGRRLRRSDHHTPAPCFLARLSNRLHAATRCQRPRGC
jgi:hypothetical protein